MGTQTRMFHEQQVEAVVPEMERRGYMDQNKEIGMFLLLLFFQPFSHNDLGNVYTICILQTTRIPTWGEV